MWRGNRHLAGLTDSRVLKWLGSLVIIGVFISLWIESHRFCGGRSSFCDKCPERASCSGFNIEDCEKGYLNTGNECIKTTKTSEELEALHEKIWKAYAHNTTLNLQDFYGKNQREGTLWDIKAAVQYTNKWNVTDDGRIERLWLRFDRNALPTFGVGSFTILMAVLWTALFAVSRSK